MLVSTTSGPRILGSVFHELIFFPSAAWFLRMELRDCDSVLDLGCGGNSVLRYIPHRYWSVGVEAWKNSLEESKSKHIHDEYILADITRMELIEKSVDAVILLEVLEHLTKEEGKLLLEKMTRVARKKIILTTPNGFVPQEDEANPHQLHKSGWEISELKDLGFDAFKGHGGLKSVGRWSDSQFAFMIVQSIPQKIAYFSPTRSNGILCMKRIDSG